MLESRAGSDLSQFAHKRPVRIRVPARTRRRQLNNSSPNIRVFFACRSAIPGS